MTRVYVTIGSSPEFDRDVVSICQHGKGHFGGFLPAVWIHWGSGRWVSITSSEREFMTLCLYCAVRSREYWPDLWPSIDKAIKIAMANGLYKRAVAASYKSAIGTSEVFREFGPRQGVPGAVARYEYDVKMVQYQLENPASAVLWNQDVVMDVVGGAAPIKQITLTPCEMCDTIHGREVTAMTQQISEQTGQLGQVGQPLANSSAEPQAEPLSDIEQQIQLARTSRAEILDRIATMVMAGESPEAIGVWQERANDYVGVIAALESQVPVPHEIGKKGGIEGMAKGDTDGVVKEKVSRSTRKAPAEPGVCWDGCNTPVPAGTRFVPGHDSKFKSLLKQIERGDVKLSAQNATFRKFAATLAKCTKCGNPIWGGVEKNEKLHIAAIPGGPGAPDALGSECAKAAKKATEAAVKAPTPAATAVA